MDVFSKDISDIIYLYVNKSCAGAVCNELLCKLATVKSLIDSSTAFFTASARYCSCNKCKDWTLVTLSITGVGTSITIFDINTKSKYEDQSFLLYKHSCAGLHF